MEDKYLDYRSLSHEEWCGLLSILEAKDNRNRAAYQIKKLSSLKALVNDFNSDEIFMVLIKKKASTGVLPSPKYTEKKTPKYG